MPEPMTPDRARTTFSLLMSTAQKRPLTPAEKVRLTYARQWLRTQRKATRRNPPIGKRARDFAIRHGINLTRDHNGNYSVPGVTRSARTDAGAIALMRQSLKTPARGRTVHNPVSAAKARRILKEGRARGRKLSPAQRGYFGARAAGLPAKNPKPIRMGRLVELRYNRDHGRAPGFYKHTFKSRPVIYYNPADNSILIKG
jgi:hypothetical protein